MESVKRANKALGLLIINIQKQCVDWASWDDLYEYVKHPSEAFEKSNLQEATFSGTKLHFIIITDINFNIIFGRYYDIANDELMEVPESVLKLLTSKSVILNKGLKDITSGVIMVDNKPLLLSAQPITTTDTTAPHNGVIIFANFLDDELIDDGIKAVTSLRVTIKPLNEIGSKDEYNQRQQIEVKGEPLDIHINQDNLLVYDIINDIDDKPILLMTIDIPRYVFKQGQKTVNYLMAIVGLSALIFGLITILILNNTVLLRLSKVVEYIKTDVKGIGESGDLSKRIEVKGNDEIARLVGAVNEMLDVLEESHNKLHYLSYYDALTGLPNRLMLSQNIYLAIAAARRRQSAFALLFIDIDNFKNVNDTMGHDVGDMLINEVAQILKSYIRDEDTLARIGGDEFVILLPNTDNADGAKTLADRIFHGITLSPLSINECGFQSSTIDCNFFVSLSAGIVMYPNDGEDISTLIKNADTAMYFAKSQGKNNYQFYVNYMHKTAAERLEMENSIRRAIEHKEFYLFYQPQINLQTGKIIGAEALIRWNHPQWGNVPPDKFIPVAEDSGLIIPISEWVIEHAMLQTKEFFAVKHLKLAVNVSMQHFNIGLYNCIEKGIARTGFSPGLFEIELTERIFMKDIDNTIGSLNKFKQKDISISIDDFGTGYSSLQYLKKL
ncbi:MAG: diguanylate cyclase, partial [Candidatus Magnetoovum sp. WYHC-5]|nr:diguanylate cyclase [Candidatus Magnetoovum sp. WYHC-5]